MTHWHIGDDAMHIYDNGKLVATIPRDAFPGIIADMAKTLTLRPHRRAYSLATMTREDRAEFADMLEAELAQVDCDDTH